MRASRFYLKTAFQQWIFAKSVSARAGSNQWWPERRKKEAEIRRSRMIVAGEDTGRTGLLFLGLQALSSRPEKSGTKKLAQRNEVKLGLSDYEVNDFPGSQFPVSTILRSLALSCILLNTEKSPVSRWIQVLLFCRPLLKRSVGRHFVSILRFFVLLSVSSSSSSSS